MTAVSLKSAQGFHPSQRYMQNVTDRSVTAYSSSDVGLWGTFKRERLYKHTACMLHAPGEQHGLHSIRTLPCLSIPCWTSGGTSMATHSQGPISAQAGCRHCQVDCFFATANHRRHGCRHAADTRIPHTVATLLQSHVNFCC